MSGNSLGLCCVNFFFFFKFVPVMACSEVCPLLSVLGLCGLNCENALSESGAL